MSSFISRRHFLLAGGGITVAFASGCSVIPVLPKNPVPTTQDALGWIQLTSVGQWRLWSPRMEMGQEATTSLRLVAARELGVSPGRIEVHLPSTDDIGRVKATVGSDSIREFALPLANACAVLRDALFARADERFGRRSDLRFSDDRIVNSAGDSVLLSEIAALPMELEAKVRPVSRLRAFSTPAGADPDHRAVHLDDIVAGRPLFSADVRLPNMVYASVMHPAWISELEPVLTDFREDAVRDIDGAITVVWHKGLAGPALVADSPAALEAMRQAAQPRWRRPDDVPDIDAAVNIDTALENDNFTKREGSVIAGSWTVDLPLEVPLAAHGAIEPRCTVARFTETGSLEVWCGTQDPFFARDVLARDQDLPPESVIVRSMRVGGGYGGRVIASVEREAAFIAKAVGRPAKVQWTREDEFRASYLRPPYSHRVKARVDQDGRISDWWHATSSSHVFFTNAAIPAWMQQLTDFVGDAGTARGLAPPYQFTRQRTEYGLTRLPVYTGPWRGLGAGPNVLAIEMAMDAAARATSQDPLRFRLRHLDGAGPPEKGDPARLAACLRRVAEIANAEALADAAANRTVARGLAGGIYKAMSYAAAIAEIIVTHDGTGRIDEIRVRKIWCVHDCGMVVHPDAVRAQIEGNLVWSLGMTLKERLDAPGGAVSQRMFGEYEIPRMSDMPALEIELVESAAMPTGAGETAIVAGAGAIANAVARAVGVTPHRMPITADTLNGRRPE